MYKWQFSVYAVMVLLMAGVVASSLLVTGNRRASGADIGTPAETLKIASALNDQAKYSESLELLVKLNRKHPDNSETKAMLQKTFFIYVQSEILKGNARIDKDKHDAEGYALIAHAYQLMNEPARALEILTTGVIENPKSVTLWSGIGVLELSQKRDAEALAVFKEILRIDAQNATALNNSAYIQSNSADPRLINMKEALAFAEKSVSLEPSNANFLDTLALIRYKRGEVEEAKRLIMQAIKLEPDEAFYKAELERFEKGKP